MQKDSAVNHQRSHLRKYWLYYFLIIFEAMMIVLFSIFVQFSTAGSARFATNYKEISIFHAERLFPFHQDIFVMIFVGFGFLFACFKNFSWSLIGIFFGTAAWTIQFTILTSGWWQTIFTGRWDLKISLDISHFTDALNTAGAVLVGLGAILGRLNLGQSIIFATILTLTQSLITNLVYYSFQANDIAGGMYIFLFGSVFGLFTSFVLHTRDISQGKSYTFSRNSVLFAWIGTLFLWVFWPSWVAFWASGKAILRAVINTILSLTGSCVMSFLISPFFSKGKLNIKHILFGSITGGTIMCSCADLITQPWAGFFIGCCAGTFALFGLEYVTPRMNKGRFQDTCGVLFLFGLPGFLSGIVASIFAGISKYHDLGDELYRLYPLSYNNQRPSGHQAGLILAVIVIVIAFASVSGLFTGFILNSSCFDSYVNLFDNKDIFDSVPEEEPDVTIKYQDKQIIELQNLNISEKVQERDEQPENVKEHKVVDHPKDEVANEEQGKEENVQAVENRETPKQAEIMHLEIQINALD